MIVLVKYPSDGNKKQKVYRAVTRAITSGAVQKDVSVVLELEETLANVLQTYCKKDGAIFEILGTETQVDPKLQAKFDLQSKILLWLAQREKSTLFKVVFELGLSKEQLQEALK